jgi:hypothetical protein
MARAACPALAHLLFRGVELTAADADAGMLLSTEAGWNQTPADWRLLLGAGVGIGIEDNTGRLVASAVIFPYANRCAWIGMVLVSASARRQKLATLMMARLLAIAAERSWLPLLDATVDGRSVYLPLGFRDLRTITRWHRAAPVDSVPITSQLTCSPLTEISWQEWDAARFGVDRSPLLAPLRANTPELALQVADAGGAFAGYSLARSGRIATQIGPIVTDRTDAAVALLDAAIARASGPLLIDLVDGNAFLTDRLRAHDFAPRRNFVRMIHGPAPEPGRPGLIRAIAGPEFG